MQIPVPGGKGPDIAVLWCFFSRRGSRGRCGGAVAAAEVRRRVDGVPAAVSRATSREDNDAKNVELSRESETWCCCGRQGESSGRLWPNLPLPSQGNKIEYLETRTNRRKT